MVNNIWQNRRHLNPAVFLKALLAGLFLILIVAVLILCSVPPVSRDALTHHLAIPKLYLEQGGIYEIPSLGFSYYPMNLDLLYLLCLYFGSDIAPKFIHFSFALLSAGLIYGYLKKRLDTLWGMLGALMFLSIPVIIKLSITAYVDLGLIFFSTASLVFFLRWVEEHYRLKNLIIAAVFCGLALGTKYNGLLTFLLLALLVPFVYSRKEANAAITHPHKLDDKGSGLFRRALGYEAVFILIALLIFSPWIARNMIWTDNPVYPLYNSWFQPQEKSGTTGDDETAQWYAASDKREKKRGLSPLRMRRVIYKETWLQVALVPIRIFFQGKDDNPRLFDGKLNPYLLIFPFFAFFLINKDLAIVKTEKLILLAFAVLYLIFAFLTVGMRIRYVAPIIPPLVILAVYGLHAIIKILMEKYPAVSAGAGTLVILIGFLFFLTTNAAYIFRQFQIVDPFIYLSGRLSRDAYIEKYRPEYPVIQYANSHLAEDQKILGLFLGNRSYYSDREIIFDTGLFRQAVINARSADMIASDLKKSGITHLIIRYDIFHTWSNAVFDARQKEMLRIFYDSNIRLIFAKGGYGLYHLN